MHGLPIPHAFCFSRAGVVALAEGTLRIISMEKLGGAFNQVGVPLTYTPRQLVIHPESNMMVVIESDHNCLSDKAMREQACACARHALCSGESYMLFEKNSVSMGEGLFFIL
jgi:hypothetical protein